MTWPVPILTGKVPSPRPTEESNLQKSELQSSHVVAANSYLLQALVVGLAGVLEPASVDHGDVVAGLWLVGAVALGQDLLGNTHVDGCVAEGTVEDLCAWS